ncbi:hypothetical protein EC142526_00576 [Escherichia coli O145:H28]|nr:hypothetical protein EC142526_00576 [Escherichia coli O145:H28]
MTVNTGSYYLILVLKIWILYRIDHQKVVVQCVKAYASQFAYNDFLVVL